MGSKYETKVNLKVHGMELVSYQLAHNCENAQITVRTNFRCTVHVGHCSYYFCCSLRVAHNRDGDVALHIDVLYFSHLAVLVTVDSQFLCRLHY